MTFLWVASRTSKAGTTCPAGMASIFSVPFESLLTRSAKKVKFSYSVRLAGHVACIFSVTVCCAHTPPQLAARTAAAASALPKCLMVLLLQVVHRARPAYTLPRAAVNAPSVEPRHHPLERGRWRLVAVHDQRIVARNDVLGRCGERAHALVAVQHVGDRPDDGEGPRLFHVGVEMACVGREHQSAAARRHPHRLQSHGVAADEMQRH